MSVGLVMRAAAPAAILMQCGCCSDRYTRQKEGSFRPAL